MASSQLWTPTSSLLTVAWTLLMSLSDAKAVLSLAKWTKRIWFEDLYMPLIHKRKSTGPNTDPCGAPNVMFDIDGLQFWLRRIVSCYCSCCFYAKQCTTQAILHFLQYLYKHIDSFNAFSLFLDSRKAFDCVNREFLLSKLNSYGIREITLDWFYSYLTNWE